MACKSIDDLPMDKDERKEVLDEGNFNDDTGPDLFDYLDEQRHEWLISEV